MSLISLIAALDEQGGIGFNNQLLAHLPADLKYFKSVTMGKSIIMGRHTYESIGKPLPGRNNIIISKTLKSEAGITVFNELEPALDSTKKEAEIFIIGGGCLFASTFSLANRLYITKIHHQFNADVFFPVIDHTIWLCKEKRKYNRDEKNDYDMTFYIYERKVGLAPKTKP